MRNKKHQTRAILDILASFLLSCYNKILIVDETAPVPATKPPPQVWASRAIQNHVTLWIV
jgi:hypothetical protein